MIKKTSQKNLLILKKSLRNLDFQIEDIKIIFEILTAIFLFQSLTFDQENKIVPENTDCTELINNVKILEYCLKNSIFIKDLENSEHAQHIYHLCGNLY